MEIMEDDICSLRVGFFTVLVDSHAGLFATNRNVESFLNPVLNSGFCSIQVGFALYTTN